MNSKLPLLSWGARVSGDKACISAHLNQFAEAGIHRLNLDVANVRRCWEEPGFGTLLRKCAEEAGLDIFDVHAPHGSIESLGYPVKEDEMFAVDSIKKSIAAASELGARTVTVHTSRTLLTGERAPGGVEYPSVDLPRAKSCIGRQLDILLPYAEKMQVVIAVENLFLPSSTGDFLNTVIKEYDSAYLGYCYDSGHALLLENFPGKNFEDIAGWIRCGWENDCVIPQGSQLDAMLENIVTCHLHDNNGIGDLHVLPGLGIADWKNIVKKLETAPRLISIQSEIKAYDTAEVSLEEQLDSFKQAGFTL